MKTKLFNHAKWLMVIIAIVTIGVGQVWATTITLKAWDHTNSQYITYGTFESGSAPGAGPVYDDGWSTYSVIAWAPGEQTDITYPGASGSDYYSKGYAWPNKDYSGSATTLYAVYYAQTDEDGFDGDYYYTTKPAYPFASECEDLADASSLAVNTSFSSGGKTYVKFTWTLGTGTSTNATYQKFCYGLDGNSGSCNATVSKTETTVTGLRSGFSNGKYWWSVQALGDGSTYCDGDAVDGPAFCIDDIKSATPTGIVATPTSTTTATITWDAVSNASYYKIYVKNNSTNATVCSNTNVTSTTFNATSLTTNTEYRVELQAFNGCDEASVKSTSYTFSIVQYTVHWYVNGALWEGVSHGSPATTVLSGARPSPLPTAPTSNDFCGSAFMGWTDHEITGSSGEPSPLFKTTAPVATGNVNFYAVFADENP